MKEIITFHNTSPKKKGMGGHESPISQNDEWLTPPWLLQKLGAFDLDPCSPVVRPWPIARHHFTKLDDGLNRQWFGEVFMNPPYTFVSLWLEKLSQYGSGIALIYARTETQFFQQYVFKKASSALFLEGRLHFHYVTGEKAPDNAGAPSVLVSYGRKNFERLSDSGLRGEHLPINYRPILIVVGKSSSWKAVIRLVLVQAGHEMPLNEIYDMIEIVAPDKVKHNQHYREKIRQQLQKSFTRMARGQYRFDE